MKKWLAWTAIILVLLVATVVLARNYIARQTIEVGMKQITGFPLEIGSLNISLTRGQVVAQNTRLFNPSDFPEHLFVDMPQFQVDYQPSSIFQNQPHITDLSLDIKELVIVKNKQGESNLAQLKGAAPSGKGAPAKPIPYKVDVLHLRVGTVKLMDYSGTQLEEHSYPLNLDVTYRDITNATDINRLVLIAVMSKLHLPDIGLNLDNLYQGLGNVKNATGEIMKNTAESLKKAGQNILEQLKKTLPGNQK